jgi:hypothetical protein
MKTYLIISIDSNDALDKINLIHDFSKKLSETSHRSEHIESEKIIWAHIQNFQAKHILGGCLF